MREVLLRVPCQALTHAKKQFPFLGVDASASFQTGSAQLAAGDTLVIFTDGMVEAVNEKEEEYSDPRLLKLVSQMPAESATATLQRLMFSVDVFVATARQHDDTTLLCPPRALATLSTIFPARWPGLSHNHGMAAGKGTPESNRHLAEQVCAVLREASHQAYFVGGCVRDLLLNRTPADYDVTTDATPDRVQQLFPQTIAVGAQFGVIVVVAGDAQVEVATFRSDIGYSDGRHPDRVEFSKHPEADVLRRDFTINGLLLDPRNGQVLDFVMGQEDLRVGLVRAIGTPLNRFREDRLRMARAARFAARFAYRIDSETLAAMQQCAPEIVLVSAERLRDELTKMLTEGAARQAFELLDESNLLESLLPEIARMKGVEQPPQYHPEGDVWIHTRLMLEGLQKDCSPTLAWGVLLHDVGKPPTFAPPQGPNGRIRFDGHVEVGARMAEEICRRLRFSNEEIAQVSSLVANHLRFKDVPQMRAATLKRFVRLPLFEEHLELHRLDCSSSHRNLENYEFVRKFLAETPPTQVRPPRILSGDDLIAAGIKPGPAMKQILAAVEDAQLDGTINSKEDAMSLVRKEFLSTM